MPLPVLVLFAFGVGVAAAMAGGNELRLSPRHALLTSSFRAFLLFLCLVVVPVSVYFYAFHGDWFLLYALDVRRIPSAVALLGFMLQAGIGVAGFSLGAVLARSQRTAAGYLVLSAALLLSAAVAVLWPGRLAVVGTFAQFRGDFGLRPYGGALLKGAVAMGAFLAVGTAYLLARIAVGGRRG